MERIQEGVSSETYTPSRNFTREEDRQIAGERRPAALIFPCLCLVSRVCNLPLRLCVLPLPMQKCARAGAVISASKPTSFEKDSKKIDWVKVSATLASVLRSQTRKQVQSRWDILRCGP